MARDVYLQNRGGATVFEVVNFIEIATQGRPEASTVGFVAEPPLRFFAGRPNAKKTLIEIGFGVVHV
jgi:hypothetical protein